MSGVETGLDRSAAVKLEITAECPFAEIAVFDSELQLIDLRLGYTELDLRPGLYKIRFSTGNAFVDEYATLVDEDSVVRGPIVPVYSPAPFRYSTTYDESEAQVAASLTERAGFGDDSAGVFFGMVRGNGSETSSPVRAMLLRQTGEVAATLVPGQSRDVGPSWCADAVKLSRGTYILQLTDGARTVEQAVVLTPGTQTQVFIYAGSDDRAESRARPTTEPAIFIGQNRPFDPQGAITRWTETVRRRLVTGLDLPLEGAVGSLARNATLDPGLAMLVLHLCLRSSAHNTSWRLLRQTIDTLPDIATHPDWVILRAANAPGSRLHLDFTQLRWPVPPMLSSTWRMIVERSADDPSCIQFGSISARVAAQVYTDGAWLAWEAMTPAGTKAEAHNKPYVLYDLAVVDIEDYAKRLLARLPPQARPDLAKVDDTQLADEQAQIIAHAAALDPFERWVFDAMLRLGAARLRAGGEASQSPAALRRDFARRFGFPAVLLGQSMATLEGKLNAYLNESPLAPALRSRGQPAVVSMTANTSVTGDTPARPDTVAR